MSAETVFLGRFSFVVVPEADAAAFEYSGVYAFIRTHILWPDPLYVGIADDLSTRARPWHEKWNRALELGMTDLVAFWQPDEQQRRDMERELIETYQPPLNVQHNSVRRLGQTAPLGALSASSSASAAYELPSARALYEADSIWPTYGAPYPPRRLR